MRLNRREFIASSGLFALTAPRVHGASGMKVLVLGAGLSGLSVAYELARKGCAVTVVEAQDRVGGRIRTIRNRFSDGMFIEAGGELIGDGYERFIGYAEKFGLEYSEYEPEPETGGSVAELQGGLGRNAYMKGQFFRKGETIENHPYGLTGDEGRMLPPTLLGRHIRQIGNDLRQGKTSMSELDQKSLSRVLSERGVSSRAINLIDISLNYNSIHTVSAAGVLNDQLRRRAGGTIPLKLREGNDRLTEALADAGKKAGASFVMEAAVTKIALKDSGIVVEAEGRDRENLGWTADHVVCTIPFSVLRGIRIEPALPEGKLEAVKRLDYTRVTKVYLQCKYTEWDRRSLGSSVWTDTSLERIFSSTGKAGDERGIFTVWTDGRGSKRMDALDPARRISYASNKFQKILPFMNGSIEKSDTISWTQNPHARGAYSHLKVGQFSSVMPHVSNRVGRLHFAGEHTAVEMPGMEGALESAERVVREISGD